MATEATVYPSAIWHTENLTTPFGQVIPIYELVCDNNTGSVYMLTAQASPEDTLTSATKQLINL